jgi:hypothetical protein
MSYSIDAVAQTYLSLAWEFLPGAPSSRQEYRFPGQAEIFAVVGPALKPRIRLVMEFAAGAATRALATAALRTALLGYDLRASDSTHVIVLDGVTYEDCQMTDFEVGPASPAVVAGSAVGLVGSYTATWRQLR